MSLIMEHKSGSYMYITSSGAILQQTSGASVLWTSTRISGEYSEEVMMEMMMDYRLYISTQQTPYKS